MEKILVIQQKMIGDVLASTVVCEHLKKHFPQAEIHFLIDEHTLPVVKGNPFIDNIVLFKKDYRKNKTFFYKFLKSIRKENYTTTIDLLCKTESNLITLFSSASKKISYSKWYSKFIYTDVYKHSQQEPSKLGMAMDNRLLLLKPLIEKFKHPDIAPKIYLSDFEIQHAKQLLVKNGLLKDKPIVMLGILGSSETKTYPLAYMAQLINHISEKYDITMLLNYMPSQKHYVNMLMANCSEKSKSAINEVVFGKSLREFLALLSHCNAYIGNEGGASHMAKALNKPNFSIFAPWISKSAWLTYQDNSANKGVHLGDYHPEALHFKSKKDRQRKITDNYLLFKPKLFQEDLFRFIDNEVIPNQ